ncbi:hypothetical protein V2J09_012631 [Rumex salicifolius]
MGNAAITSAGAGGGRKAKIMKINGEFFKFGTPAKVRDIIGKYPGHILLDSDEFRRFNLRARPLDPEFDLQPKKIYLLVELPRFPSEEDADNTPRRSNYGETSRAPENFRVSQPSASPVRVKVKLPKAQVERILEQTSDDAEAAGKIIDLCMDDDGRAAAPDAEGKEDSERKGRWTEIGEDETTEKVSFNCQLN